MTLNPRQKRNGSDSKPENGARDPYLIGRTGAFFSHLKKFGWDLFGTFLLLAGVLSLLGKLGLSRGTLINSWIDFLSRNLGWGSYLFALILIYLGIAVFVHISGRKSPISIARVVALEGAFFSLLPVLSLTNGLSLDRAIQGLDGGTLGWGLAQAIAEGLSIPVALAFYSLILILCLAAGSGLAGKLANLARSWSESPEKTNRKSNITTTDLSAVVTTNRNQNAQEFPSSEKTRGRDSRLPPLNLLFGENVTEPDQNIIKGKARLIESKLAEFGLPVKVIGFRVGPTVTQFALEPGYVERIGPDGDTIHQKVKVAQIASLSRDLALALSASRLRIETPVPGRSYVGIEVPNDDSAFVRMRPVLESNEFRKLSSPLAVGLGRNVSGDVVAADLEKLPHLLVAGTTNSGKSVCITSIISSLVLNNSPEDLKLVMIDPKMVELVRFNGLPHLIGRVETELERMLAVLQWAQAEMDSRYRLLAEAHARNLETYNQRQLARKKPTLPRIVIFIDEMADMMMSAPDQTEHCLTRLAQMARATGMHLVVATQRPSTDVVTGVIKANFPARIAFAVPSSVDSRVILDSNGAESLLGKGDMLFLDPSRSGLQRLQGIIMSDVEIEKILTHWQKVSEPAAATEAPWEGMVQEEMNEDSDRLIQQAIAVVKASGKASTSLLQRRLKVGFPRAARLIDELEARGIVGPAVGSGKDREVLVDPDDGEEEVDQEDD